MYIDSGIIWAKELKKKNVFIFGAGQRGSILYHKLKAIGINRIEGVIDNDTNKVKIFNEGKGWISKAYLPEEFEKYYDARTDFIIISIDQYFEEIRKQLFEQGIYNVLTYNDIDLIGKTEEHYDANYFNRQIEIAEVDSCIDKLFFEKYIGTNDIVAEFGCGGGLLLGKLNCKKKVGIEINARAREYAEHNGVETVHDLDELPNSTFDIIITTHALEHCLNPYQIVCKINDKLKIGGRFVCVVPYEPLSNEYMINDVNQHLFIWNQRTLGNLLRAANLYIRETGVKSVAWPDNWKNLYEQYGKEMFETLTELESNRLGYYSVYAVGEKYE